MGWPQNTATGKIGPFRAEPGGWMRGEQLDSEDAGESVLHSSPVLGWFIFVFFIFFFRISLFETKAQPWFLALRGPTPGSDFDVLLSN